MCHALDNESMRMYIVCGHLNLQRASSSKSPQMSYTQEDNDPGPPQWTATFPRGAGCSVANVTQTSMNKKGEIKPMTSKSIRKIYDTFTHKS
jgi:hypothetical protein